MHRVMSQSNDSPATGSRLVIKRKPAGTVP